MKICSVSNSLFLRNAEERDISRSSSVKGRRQGFDSMRCTFSTEEEDAIFFKLRIGRSNIF